MEKKKSGIMEFVPYLVIIIVVILVKVFIVTPIRVNGPSMNDTLHNNDIMILDEISYKISGIDRFDIVVLRYHDEYLIKRVIGLPGDKVKYIDNQLYINEKAVDEDFDHAITGDFSEIEVPDGEYFVLGDNRVNSTDSRKIGTVSIKDIRGTTNLTVFPFSRFGKKK